MRTLLKGGTVVTGRGTSRCDVLIEGQTIRQVGRLIISPADRVEDVEGCLLFPGFIDSRTHFDQDADGSATADDFASGSRAALAGGTTTVLDLACPDGSQSLREGLELWHWKAQGRTFCDYGFHMTVGHWDESIRSELPEMLRQGVTSFQLYMAHPSLALEDRALYWAMKEIHHLGAISSVQCESAGVMEGIAAEYRAAGQTSPAAFPHTRPSFLEAEAVSRLLRLAQAVGCPVIIAPLTAQEALREIERARNRGQKVYAQTCPQYLLLDESVYENEDAALAARYVCAPPLRQKTDQQALWQGLHRGEIQILCSDHRAFTPEQKAQEDFASIPCGLPGVEHLSELIYGYGVVQKRLSPAGMCRILSEHPAKLYGLFPKKGALRSGSDADIVVVDPRHSRVIRGQEDLCHAGYSPYEGFVTAGAVRSVFLRGRKVAEHGRILDTTPSGQYLSRTPGKL